jgi:predicted metal-dependent HD superfamily phosphohydrolase
MSPLSFYESEQFVKLRNELIARYNEPHRFYHNIFHINDMLNIAMGCRPSNIGMTNLIIWYHDAIYDPQRKDNEEKSAEFAIDQLKDHLSSDDVDTVASGILLTKHQFSSNLLTPDMSIIIDADLYILSHDWCYTAYARAIRKEYAHLNDFEYIAGRKQFLEKMLRKNSYYGIFYIRNAKAKKNMQTELDYLNKNILM